MSLIKAEKIVKTYQSGEFEIQAIGGVSFDIDKGAFVSFVGPSGSGKTTLLNMIGCLDNPTSGKLTVVGEDLSGFNSKQSALFRGQHIGFVFQDFSLLPVLTVYENVEYPLVSVQNLPAPERVQRVNKILEAVGMTDQANKFPGQISGGQKQRVAVARALVTEPKLVLADEPTANLDSKSAHNVIELMKEMRDLFGTTFIFSTHDPKVMGVAEKTFTLVDGLLVDGEVQ
jgi:putative ABC transport system ATP-binding protein